MPERKYETQRCKKCRVEKPMSDFTQSKRKKQIVCKECNAAIHKENAAKRKGYEKV